MKDVEYYRRLPYAKRVQRMEDDGVYYLARVEEIPFVAIDGATPEEALMKLQEVLEDAIESMLASGDRVPEPVLWPDNLRPSGFGRQLDGLELSHPGLVPPSTGQTRDVSSSNQTQDGEWRFDESPSLVGVVG